MSTRHSKLLLVDDDRLVLATLGLGLQDAGYVVHTAESVQEAQNLLAEGLQPDLAILDIRMGNNEGWENKGLQIARQLSENGDIPFLMFSAYSNPDLVDEANSLGALAYLVKPLDVSQMLPAIESALSRASDLFTLRATKEQLQTALNAERAISIAVGVVMASCKLDREQAFELLRSTARSQRRKLVDLAEEVIRNGDYTSSASPGTDPGH